MEEDGQITVFLALMFLIMLGVSFLIFGGMREYLKSSLIEENMSMVGEDILAQFDKPLFERYHIFLMDPREEKDILEEAQGILKDSFDSSGYFSDVTCQLSLLDKKTALENKGEAVKKQIKAWETYQGVYQLSSIMKQLLKSTDSREDIEKQLEDTGREGDSQSASDGEQDDSRDTSLQQEKDSEEKKEETAEEKKVKSTWKEWKSTLESVLDSGILLYAMDDMNKVSRLELSDTSLLPSKDFNKSWNLFDMDSISLTGISQLTKLFDQKYSSSEPQLLENDLYMIPYVLNYFSSYEKKVDQKEHALNYEIEYLLVGKTKDKANLKCVAEQIFLLRFITNYIYAMNDGGITSQAHTMALILTGIFELPQLEKQVATLLIASLCYGESLLEVRSLLQGKQVALLKSQENWNLSFANAAAKLSAKADIIKPKNGISYQQYLMALLILKCNQKGLLYRCMDLMQCNVALEEEGFLLKNCIYSYQWKGCFSWNPAFESLPVFGRRWKDSFSMDISKTVTYQ